MDIIGRSDLTAPLPKVGEPEVEGALPHKDISGNCILHEH